MSIISCPQCGTILFAGACLKCSRRGVARP